MSEITIEFRGICTHLLGVDIEHPKQRTLTMIDAEGQLVPHRVFLASPSLYREFETRYVSPHTPKMHIGMERAKPLRPVVMHIEGAVDDSLEYGQSFALPSLSKLTHRPFPEPWLREEVREPWTPLAQVLFNFYSGATFAVEPGNHVRVTVRIRPDAVPYLVCSEPGKEITRTRLHHEKPIVITNCPDGEILCMIEDYLLHYVPIHCDLRNLPVWPRPVDPVNALREKRAGCEGNGPNHEVYCSNSTYP